LKDKKLYAQAIQMYFLQMLCLHFIFAFYGSTHNVISTSPLRIVWMNQIILKLN